MSSEKEHTSQQPNTKAKQDNWFGKILSFFWEIIRTFFHTLRALIFLIVKTPYILLPSAAHTSIADTSYNKKMREDIGTVIDSLKLEDWQKQIISQNWLGQIEWTNDRSTRERDANEVIRWWQIILGVLIPVLTNLDFENKNAWVSLAGISVAILTAIYQFRRPEERWRHYRVVTEQYLNELWSFVALSGDGYAEYRQSDLDHKGAFVIFHARMTTIRQEDAAKFFGEVVKPSSAPDTLQNPQPLTQQK
ncbi:MAG: DUF4231 domain-containing protein [Anaerolineae bacterium]|nr:DUF4231 domain-containing protein [Anaerolineae bacterium]